MQQSIRGAVAVVIASLVLTGCVVLPPGSTPAAAPPQISDPVQEDGTELEDPSEEDTAESATPEPSPTAAEQTPAAEPSPAAEPAPAAPPAPTLTLAQQNAIGSAQDYLDFMHFSSIGLIEQLEYEGFANTDAAFAVDSLGVDWNAQAAGSAQDYLDFMSFSRQGLLDQLLYEGFSPSEAEYGVAAVGY